MLTLNLKAPQFEGVDQLGKIHKLSDFLGKWVVLYFYPKDATPGCTKEACSFRDSYRELEKFNVEIIGVSKDSVESHKKFAEKYHLNFSILADPEKVIIQQYGAWGEKKFMGKTFQGTKRMTYLIDPSAKIRKIYASVNPLTHAGQILKDLESFKAS